MTAPIALRQTASWNRRDATQIAFAVLPWSVSLLMFGAWFQATRILDRAPIAYQDDPAFLGGALPFMQYLSYVAFWALPVSVIGTVLYAKRDISGARVGRAALMVSVYVLGFAVIVLGGDAFQWLID